MSQDQTPVVPVAPAAAPEPIAPRGLEPAAASEIQDKARALVAKLATAVQDRDAVRSLGSLGGDAQQRAGREMDLLQTKVGTLLNDLDGPGSKIPQGLVKLRKTILGHERFLNEGVELAFEPYLPRPRSGRW